MGEQRAKRCVACGADLTGKPRVKDARGNYACPAWAQRRERCEPAAQDAPEPVAAGAAGEEDRMLGLEDFVEAERSAEGPMQEIVPIEVEPETRADRACPVCTRPFPAASESCAACGFRRDVGIRSSMFLKKTSTDHARTVLCPKCGYDMGAGTSIVCPECGTKAELETSRSREKRAADQVARQAYREPAMVFGACFLVMLALQGATAGTGGVVLYLVGIPIELVLGWLVYTILCLMWIGFDAPQHLILLRLLAVNAASSVAFTVADFIPIPLLPFAFAVLTYLSLLMYFLEMEMQDAMILAVGTFLAKVAAFLLVVAVLAGMLA